MYSDFQNYLSAAIDAVLGADIPEDALPDTIRSQACLMAGINPDEVLWYYSND